MAVQWLNKTLCIVLSGEVAVSFLISMPAVKQENPKILEVIKRYNYH
jgi:hypothetical protein